MTGPAGVDPAFARLWAQLAEEGLVTGPAPLEPAPPASQPWIVRIMLGGAGFIGALFVFGFFAALFAGLFRNNTGLVLLALAGFALAHRLFRLGQSDLAQQFALVASLVGQVCLAIVLFERLSFEGWRQGALALCAIEIVLALLMPNALHRFLSWSAAFACWAAFWFGGPQSWVLSVATPLLAVPAMVLLWQAEDRWMSTPAHARLRPLLHALTLTSVALALWAHGPLWWEHGLSGAGGPAGIGLFASLRHLGPAGFATGMLLVVGTTLRQHAPHALAPGLALAALAVFLFWSTPGVLLGATLMALGFSRSHRALLGLGIVAGLAGLSHFYYALHMTLLDKSWLLMASGGLALAAGRWLETPPSRNTGS